MFVLLQDTEQGINLGVTNERMDACFLIPVPPIIQIRYCCKWIIETHIIRLFGCVFFRISNEHGIYFLPLPVVAIHSACQPTHVYVNNIVWIW